MHLKIKMGGLVKNRITEVIRACKSPWNSLIVVVRKKRIYVHYRQLNEVTENLSFPMNDTQLLLDCLIGVKCFSLVNLVQDFNTEEGVCFFNRILFDLSTAPVPFQILKHEFLKGVIVTQYNGEREWKFIYGYRSSRSKPKIFLPKFT